MQRTEQHWHAQVCEVQGDETLNHLTAFRDGTDVEQSMGMMRWRCWGCRSLRGRESRM